MSAAPTVRSVTRGDLPAGDYVSPGLRIVLPDACFPDLVVADRNGTDWPWLRREIPHNFLADRRQPRVGFLNRDEAQILYNSALPFAGQPALEIGCWLGWSACHPALTGVHLDVVDPLLARAEIRASVQRSLSAAQVLDRVNLVPGPSPQAVRELAQRHGRRWSLIFIDGNHDAPGPLHDAQACEALAADDALILFHDLASPDVAQGLDYFRRKGWHTRIYDTMQVMGAAWRGRARPIDHVPDPAVRWTRPDHLRAWANGSAESADKAPAASGDKPAMAGFPDFDPEFVPLYAAARPYTMTSPERMYGLFKAVQYLVANRIDGDFVECGVWKGGSTMLAASTLLRCGDASRELWLYDTFAGMTEPERADVDHSGQPAAEHLRIRRMTAGQWCRSPLEEVRAVMAQTAYPAERIRYIVGPVEQTIPANAPDRIALLRLDTDWYRSTKHELEHLYSRLVKGGVLIIDDYGHWRGCRTAVDEFFATQATPMLLNRLDYTGRIGVKLGD